MLNDQLVILLVKLPEINVTKLVSVNSGKARVASGRKQNIFSCN